LDVDPGFEAGLDRGFVAVVVVFYKKKNLIFSSIKPKFKKSPSLLVLSL